MNDPLSKIHGGSGDREFLNSKRLVKRSGKLVIGSVIWAITARSPIDYVLWTVAAVAFIVCVIGILDIVWASIEEFD